MSEVFLLGFFAGSDGDRQNATRRAIHRGYAVELIIVCLFGWLWLMVLRNNYSLQRDQHVVTILSYFLDRDLWHQANSALIGM